MNSISPPQRDCHSPQPSDEIVLVVVILKDDPRRGADAIQELVNDSVRGHGGHVDLFFSDLPTFIHFKIYLAHSLQDSATPGDPWEPKAMLYIYGHAGESVELFPSLTTMASENVPPPVIGRRGREGALQVGARKKP
jgi:hypothetical protein